MEAIRIETTIEQDGEITLENLPLHAGENVEIIILRHPKASSTPLLYSMRGLPITYHDPFGSVAEEEWDALG